MPATVTKEYFTTWLAEARYGAELVYFEGDLNHEVYLEWMKRRRYASEGREDPGQPLHSLTRYVRDLAVGTGMVFLYQRRLGPSEWAYVARRAIMEPYNG